MDTAKLLHRFGRNLLTTLTTCFLALHFSSAHAATVVVSGTSVDVGNLDTFIEQATKSTLGDSSEASEVAWASGVLGTDMTFEYKKENLTEIYTTDIVGTFAFMLDEAVDYFIIKNSTWWALYQNNTSLDWAVFNAFADGLNGFNLKDENTVITTISHVTGLSAVPVPASIYLFGSILLGAFGLRIKRLQNC